MRALALALALALVFAGPAIAQVQPRPRPTHDEAVAALTGTDLEARRQAVAWLGEIGTPADLPAMMKTLRDADEVVRALAESSIWQVWSRSGDAKVDALFAVGVEQMSTGDAKGAIETFTKIIKARPDLAEFQRHFAEQFEVDPELGSRVNKILSDLFREVTAPGYLLYEEYLAATLPTGRETQREIREESALAHRSLQRILPEQSP